MLTDFFVNIKKFGCLQYANCCLNYEHFAKKYKKLLKEALIINLDLVGSGRKSTIHTKEKYYGAKMSPEAVEFTLKAAKRAGIDAIPYVAPAGGSDAAALCYHGLKATTVFNQAEDKWPPMWHNDSDRPENIDPVAIENIFTPAALAI